VEDLFARERCVAVDGIEDATVNPGSVIAKDIDGQALFVVLDVAVASFLFDVVFEDST
jgi:hypothetical protein